MQMIQSIESEVEKNKQICNVDLPREIKGKQVRLEQVQKSLAGESYTNFAIEQLTQQVESMKGEVNKLEKKKLQPAANDRLHQFRPQAQAVASRKKDQRARMRLLQEERDGLAQQLQTKEDEWKALGDQKVLTGEEFKRYAAQLREKHGVVKRTRVEEQEIKSELVILNRSEQVLSSRGNDMQAVLAKMEQERGVSGYMGTQAQLEKVSEQKQEVDEQKGQTLETMSSVVTQLTQKIKDQKLKLKEPIKDLKYVLRPKYKELGEEYKEKKTKYDHAKHQETRDIEAIQTQVKDLEEECARDEMRWHQTNARMQVNQVLDSRLAPCSIKEPGSGATCRSYKELYTARIQSAQKETDKMRKMQKDVKQMYEPAKAQMEMLSSCQRLLQCKRHCLRMAQNDGMGGGDPSFNDGGNQGAAFQQENLLVL